MKKQLLLTLFVAASLFSFNSNAQTLVHYWNFSNVTAPVYLPTPVVHATYSRIDTNKANVWYTTVAGTSSAYVSYFDAYPAGVDSTAGVTQGWNARFGDYAGNAIRLRNPSDSMEMLAYIPTTHYKNPMIKYVVESSGSGMKKEIFDYSVDSGATWSTAGLSAIADSPINITWMSVTLNINSTTDPLTENNPRLIFRVRFLVNNIGTSGNDRIDNLTMEADTFMTSTIVEPVTLAAPVYTLYPNPVVNTVELNGDIDGAKSIMIRAVDGKTVYAALQSGKHISVDVADFAAGTYFVTVHEASTGTTSTVKFIKQ